MLVISLSVLLGCLLPLTTIAAPLMSNYTSSADAHLQSRRSFTCGEDGMFIHWSCASLNQYPTIMEPAEVEFRHSIAPLCNDPKIAPALAAHVECRFRPTYEKYYNADGWAEDVYVTYVGAKEPDSKYVKMTTLLIDSVHMFSTRPVIVYCVTSFEACKIWSPEQYPQLIVFHVAQTDQTRAVAFDMHKWRGMLLSRGRAGAQMDADQILLPLGDELFAGSRRHTTHDYPFPLMAVHWMSRDPEGGDYSVYQYNYEGHRSMRWGHAHITWTHYATPFLCEYYKRALTNETVRHWADEELANRMLWEAHATKQYCKWDHFLDGSTVDHWFKHHAENIAPKGMYSDHKWYPDGIPIVLYTFHNAKDPERTKIVLELLKEGWKTAKKPMPGIFYQGEEYYSPEDFRTKNPNVLCVV